MLCANGQPDRGIMDSLVLQLFFGQLGVGRGSRVDHQGFYIGNIGKQAENLQGIDEPVGFLFPAFDVEGENRSAAMREILFVQCMIRVIRQRWVVYFADMWMVLQEVHDFSGILHMAVQPQRERLCTLQQQEGIEGRNRSPGIPQQDRPDVGGKGSGQL